MNTGEISGKVTDAEGRPVSGAVVLITGDSPSHLDIAALSDSAGRYRFDGLTPGRYTLLVNAQGSRSLTRQVSVSTNQVAELNFSFEEY
jgi:protocatechuate 3,4-dioxygenase beta subunit